MPSPLVGVDSIGKECREANEEKSPWGGGTTLDVWRSQPMAICIMHVSVSESPISNGNL